MKRFNELLNETSWQRVEEDIDVFISSKDGVISVNFPVAQGFKSEDFDSCVEAVLRFIETVCCCNKFKEENKNWCVPLLISDYFAHKEDWESEFVWAQKAMRENSKLKPEHFSVSIRSRL